jgi:hypothetical protein
MQLGFFLVHCCLQGLFSFGYSDSSSIKEVRNILFRFKKSVMAFESFVKSSKLVSGSPQDTKDAITAAFVVRTVLFASRGTLSANTNFNCPVRYFSTTQLISVPLR